MEQSKNERHQQNIKLLREKFCLLSNQVSLLSEGNYRKRFIYLSTLSNHTHILVSEHSRKLLPSSQ